MSENERRPTQQLLQQAKNIHNTIKTNSTELQNKLSFMQKSIQNGSSFLSCGFCSSNKFKVEDGFKRAYKKLSASQQVMLFWRMCKCVKLFKQKKAQDFEDNPLKEGQRQMLDTTIYIKDGHDYKEWTVTRIKAYWRSRKISITDQSTVFDLHDYIIRSTSSKQKQKCFALECKTKGQACQTVRISNEGTSYEELIRFLKKIEKQAIKDEVREAMGQGVSKQQLKVSKSEVKSQSSIPTPMPLINSRVYNSTEPLSTRMMTLKLTSPQYASTALKVIQKQILERQRVIRIKDQSYNEIYKYLLPSTLLTNLDSLSGFQKIRQNSCSTVYYNQKQQKIKKKYKISCTNEMIIFDWLVDQLNNFSNFKKWKQGLQRINCLKVFPSQKTKLFHQVYKQGSQRYNYVYIRHHFDLQNSQSTHRNKKSYYFYDQSICTPIAKSYFQIPQPIAHIQYIIWKFSEIHDIIELVIQAKVNHFVENMNQNVQMVESYLGDFQKLKNHAIADNDELNHSQIHLNTIMFQNQYIQQINEIQDIDHDTEYFTVTDTFNDNQQITTKNPNIRSSQVNNSSKNGFINGMQGLLNRITSRKSITFDQKNQGSLLRFHHPVVPYHKPTKPNWKAPKKSGEHHHWQTQWIINQKGQLININKQKIKAQNDVLKSVFKRLGRNIMSGKSILSISLPVQAFGDDSNLSRLCNSYGYAPLFLERAAQAKDPVERFKNVISFGITATVNYIRMDKPFNPILGQTYQSLIDGCPVYGEQISHHPPISAVFMKGRGFTLYGHFEAKVELSLNSANGVNQGEMHVCFNETDYGKNLIRYSVPPGELSGLIYGDRKMSMIKKSYYFDEDNLLYCQVNWGKHKGKSQFANKFHDSVEAQIVKIRPGVDPKKVKKQDIQHQIGLINGRWTGAVYYDSQLLFDTYKSPPYIVEEYKALLESDVEKRKDLLLRRNSANLQVAQQAKQQLQEIQRRDRKLRAEYTGKKH